MRARWYSALRCVSPSNADPRTGRAHPFCRTRTRVDGAAFYLSAARKRACAGASISPPLNPSTLSPGTRLGPYEIVALLGVGGMGEVYRATDTKLKRQVAIKVLPAALTADHDRLARFQREAEVLASLNHPHIAQIYGLEESDGVRALVMELVEGPTLADRIARGAIPIGGALPVARQIADALEAAHEQGIIHRDLKPSNIKVRSDGTVKVLDFGLAKVSDPVGRAGTEAEPYLQTASPTITTPAMTGAGIILGTAAYMSPEQAKGRTADKRSDVWAFGCVLFEMLTGARAFEGEDVSETLATVLKDEPAWHRLPAETPDSIRRLLRRCQQKDRKDRLRDIGDARAIRRADRCKRRGLRRFPRRRTGSGGRREETAGNGAPSVAAARRVSPPPVHHRWPRRGAVLDQESARTG